jgi:transcriptional regulator with XRE-family HTH domain
MSKQYTLVQHPLIKSANRRIAMAVRIYRTNMGMSEQTLANLLEIPINSLSRLELGKQQWPAAIIPTLSMYLNVDPMAFFVVGKGEQENIDNFGKKPESIDVSMVKKVIRQLSEMLDKYEEEEEDEEEESEEENCLPEGFSVGKPMQKTSKVDILKTVE